MYNIISCNIKYNMIYVHIYIVIVIIPYHIISYIFMRASMYVCIYRLCTYYKYMCIYI